MKMRVFSVIIVLPLAALLLVSCEGTRKTDPSEVTGKLDWWPTQAMPQPVDDPRENVMGRWWWPTNPGMESSPVWGNRGYVYVLKWSKITDTDRPPELTKVFKDVEGLVLDENVLFDFDKSEITPVAQGILKDVAAKLKEYPDVTLTIEGHTCSIGTEAYNMALGKRRAESVKQFLVSQGIDPNRLETISYGETRLKVPERHAEDFAKNRRVEFEVHE